MSTGSVVPFTPNQPSQVVTPSNTANSLLTINPCDAILFYNSGTVLCYAAFGWADKLYAATPIIAGAVPLPPGQSILIGTPGVLGVSSEDITQVAILAAAGSAGAVYVQPGLGTQH